MHIHRLRLLWTSFVVLLSAPSLSFGTLVYPPDLSAGDVFRIVFVTSVGTTPGSTDISYYNDFVNSAANSAGSELAVLGTTWTAIASTTAVHARDNIGGTFSDRIYLPDGTLIAAGTSGLWDASIDHAINLTEIGGTYAGNVWTGSSVLGYTFIGLGTSPGAFIGQSFATDTYWIQYTNTLTSYSYPLYGISAQLTVPSSAPEPGTFGLISFGLVGLAFWKRRTSRAR